MEEKCAEGSSGINGNQMLGEGVTGKGCHCGMFSLLSQMTPTPRIYKVVLKSVTLSKINGIMYFKHLFNFLFPNHIHLDNNLQDSGFSLLPHQGEYTIIVWHDGNFCSHSPQSWNRSHTFTISAPLMGIPETIITFIEPTPTTTNGGERAASGGN